MRPPKNVVLKCVEVRRGGRPRSPEPGSAVCTWLRTSEHDRLIKAANQRDMSVSEFVRSLVIIQLNVSY